MQPQNSPGQTAAHAFRTTFGQKPAVLTTAPGRVNLIGEHTDYNDGFVLPVAINFHTAVAAAARDDDLIDVVALDENNQRVQFSVNTTPEFDTQAFWSNYIRGVVNELQTAGYKVRGANLAISGNVPMGAGLSSSASLEVAVIAALTQISDTTIDATAAAKVGQAAENNFVGCQCGIMDQLICAAGQPDNAVLLDCRSLAMQKVSIPKDLALVVIDSRVQRKLVDGEYNTRRLQCEAAAKHFRVRALRDVSLAQLKAASSALDSTVYKRARHVVTENQRTLDMADALRKGHIDAVSHLMAASHLSMRDDFAITVPEIDHLVAIVQSVVGQHGGARMTGGGFGGCIVALVPHGLVEEVLHQVEKKYPLVAKHAAVAYVCQPSAGGFYRDGNF